jgi:hypothetical protein
VVVEWSLDDWLYSRRLKRDEVLIAVNHVDWMIVPGFGRLLEAVHSDGSWKGSSFESQKTTRGIV